MFVGRMLLINHIVRIHDSAALHALVIWRDRDGLDCDLDVRDITICVAGHPDFI